MLPSKIFRRWALGTAQFGFPYGVANKNGVPTLSQLQAILQCGFQAGLRTLDTAMAYGESEEHLGRSDISSWEVITKLPAHPFVAPGKIAAWVEENLQGSLQRLRLPQISGLLFHRSEDLLGPHGADLWAAARSLKERGWIKKLGVSVYEPKVLKILLREYPLEIVQLPLNPLDRRFLENGFMKELKKRHVEIHARSVFLQGLLLLSPPTLHPFFDRWQPLLNRWHSWACAKPRTPLLACINFCKEMHLVDRFIIGVDNAKQLEQILEVLLVDKPERTPDFNCQDPDLLDPGRWFKP